MSLVSAQHNLSTRATGIELTPLQKALAAVAQPNILSLAMGLPDTSLFPHSDLAHAAEVALSRDHTLLQYSLPCHPLKEQICRFMLDKGVDCSPNRIFLTHGAQQAISLLSLLFLDEGDPIFEEEISYPGFQNLVDIYKPQVFRIPTSRSDGIDVDTVARLLESGVRPSYIYLMPNAHNPLGVDLPLYKRQALALLSEKYNVPLIEDDPYGALIYEGEHTPPICTLAPNSTFYVGSFSKLLGPSFRVGWIVAPAEYVEVLSIIKEGSDLNVTTFSQWVINEYLNTTDFHAHLRRVSTSYRLRRAAMDQALRTRFPSQARWRIPNSGFFFWIDLPQSVDSNDLLTVCLRDERVAFLPSHAFSRSKITNGMRLNFTRCTEGQISEGVARIGRVLSQFLGSE